MSFVRILKATAIAGVLISVPVGVLAKGSQILFILDASGSMAGKVDGETKMSIAKTALSKLVGDLPKDTKLGLMAYGHRLDRRDPAACSDIELLLPVGEASADTIKSRLAMINPKGKTPIASSLEQTAAAFAGLEKTNNNIVLISDGIETCSGNACAVSEELAKSNINVRVHVVGFDIAKKDREQLQCIAEAGKGIYFPANSTEGFTKAITDAIKVAQAETKPEPKPAPEPPKPVIYFEDNFDGEELGESWEIRNPNPDAYIVEDGALLMISGSVGALAEETVENVLKLSQPLPKGDWTITTKLLMELQTGVERAFIGVIKDRDNYLETAVRGVVAPWGNNRFSAVDISALKRSKGKDKITQSRLWKGPLWNSNLNYITGIKDFPQPVLLRLQKQGRSYISSARLEGVEEPKWVTLDKFTILRLKGSVSMGFYQLNNTKSESTASFDWIKIETPK